MTEALKAVDRMREFIELDHDPGSAAAWVAKRLAEYIEAAGEMSADDALGVAPKRGEWPWWRLERRVRTVAASRRLIAATGDPRSALRQVRRYALGRGKQGADVAADDERAIAAAEYLAATDGQVPESPKTLMRAALGGTDHA